MAVPDRRAIELAGGWEARMCVIPAAAAPDQNHKRAGANASRWFESLGALQLNVLPLIDRDSANDPQIAAELRSAQFIYMLGGFTHYLGETLLGSPAAKAMRIAYENGAVIGGSSAGAMVLCQHYYDPGERKVFPGLDYVHSACVIPHHNTFGKGWTARLAVLLPDDVLIGIDERTGMIDDGGENGWKVYGQGNVTLYQEGESVIYQPGEVFQLKHESPRI